MGRILIHDFFEIYIFSRDHLPAHIHVYFPKKSNMKGFVKLEIQSLTLLELEGISQKDFKKVLSFLTEERILLLKNEWERLHGKEKN